MLTKQEQFILNFVNGKTDWITNQHKNGEVKELFLKQKIGDYVTWLFNEYPFNWLFDTEEEINFSHNSFNYYVLKPGFCFTNIFPGNQIKKNYHQLVVEYKTKDLILKSIQRQLIVNEYLPR